MPNRTSLVACALIASSVHAHAYPNVRAGFSGSTFMIYASNGEDRSFACNYQYSFEYFDFGTTRLRNDGGSFLVNARANDGIVFQQMGSWENPRLRSFSFTCA